MAKRVKEKLLLCLVQPASWYFLRYIDPNNETEIADYKLLKHWLPVDLYVGGPEHSVGHLLYSRFWNNFFV